LDITTTTKPLKPSDIPDEADPKPLFPAPPTDATSVELRIDRETLVKAEGLIVTVTNTISDHVGYLGGLGPTNSYGPSRRASQARIWQDEPQWTAAPTEHQRSLFGRNKESEGRRICTRATHFATTIELTCPPSLDVGIIRTAVSPTCILVQINVE
jgi:hypothetical protein